MLKFTSVTGAKVTTSFLTSFKLKTMKTRHLLLFLLIAVFSSCSSAYRTTQTPDDVYYSPAPPPPIEYVTTENQQDKDTYANHNADISEDLAIRRGINDSRYRSNISLDFGYGYSPYGYYGSSFYSPYSSFYNPYTYTGATFYPHNYNYYGYNSPFTNYYYSPFNNYYYPPIYVSTPVSNYRGARTYNLGVYNNNVNANRVNMHPGQPNTTNSVPVAPVRTFPTQPSNNRSGVGNLIRRVFTPSNNTRSYSNDNDNGRSYRNDNSSNNNSSPARTTTSGSSSSSSSGSSSAPVRTFR
jgi:hypothetical protein